MNGKQTKKLIWETNTPPPTNYIWVKPNGKPYEFNNNTKKWEESDCFGGISENMSEEEQMEIRKNLGLYYEEPSVGEKTAKRETGSAELFVKISDDTPEKNDIISVGDYNIDNISFSDTNSGYYIMDDVVDAQNILFQIRNKVVDDYPVGIYALLSAIGMPLVYKGEVTTVSKIDAKFLPEDESSLKWLDLKGGRDLPLPIRQDETVADLSSYISQEDWEKLLKGEYIGIHTPENANNFVYDIHRILLKSFGAFSIQNPIYSCVFADVNAKLIVNNVIQNIQKQIILITGKNINNVIIKKIPIITEIHQPIVLTALPEESMTTQEQLDAIGFTAQNVEKLVRGNAPYLCLKNQNGYIINRFNLEYANYTGISNFELQFTNKTDRYLVVNNNDRITVTKTSLS